MTLDMKLSRILVSAMGLFLLSSAAFAVNPPTTRIVFSIPGKDVTNENAKVYIFADGSKAPVDSISVPEARPKHTVRVVKASLPASPVQRYKAVYGDLVLYFFNEQGLKIHGNMENDFCAKGTPLNDAYFLYQTHLDEALEPISKKADAIQNDAKMSMDAKKEAISKLAEEYQNLQMKALQEGIEKHLNDVLGAVLLIDSYNYLSADKFMSLLNKASKEVKDYPMMDRLSMMAANTLNTSEGKPYIDVEGYDPADTTQTRTLSSYVKPGNYTIVDFWASWCGPCRREIRQLKQIYEKYKDEKFQIVGAAVWDETPNTMKAMKQMNIPWPVFSAKTSGGESVDVKYGISGIPTILLIGPDGKILVRSHSSEEIVKILAGAFKK